MRIGFAGTPAFAATALRTLAAAGHSIALVLTQPDRPSGRGMKLQASAVKQVALELGIPVAQPRGLKLDGKYAEDAAAARIALEAAGIDALIVAAYGLLLPRWLLELPRHGCLNIHGSLLPRWRGAAPVQRAIEAGDAMTGVTIMQMDEGLDTGPMRLVRAIPILPADDSGALMERLAVLGAEAIVATLADLGAHPPVTQPTEGIAVAAKIAKDEAPIDWSLAAAAIERRTRAFDPFPGCSFSFAGETVKLWRARIVELTSGAEPGTVLVSDEIRLRVACGEACLDLSSLQWPGGRRQDWPPAPARRPPAGSFLGNRERLEAGFAGRPAEPFA